MADHSLTESERTTDPAAVALGKRSAKARMVKLTPEQRSEVARTAVTARWDKAKDKPTKGK